MVEKQPSWRWRSGWIPRRWGFGRKGVKRIKETGRREGEKETETEGESDTRERLWTSPYAPLCPSGCDHVVPSPRSRAGSRPMGNLRGKLERPEEPFPNLQLLANSARARGIAGPCWEGQRNIFHNPAWPSQALSFCPGLDCPTLPGKQGQCGGYPGGWRSHVSTCSLGQDCGSSAI